MLRKGDNLTRTERLLCDLVDEYEAEDRSARERQMLLCKKLKLFWDNFQQVWYSEVAHDWRVNIPAENDDQAHYDKPVNIFRAYLESLIAALSVTVPPLECYPDDAENELDLMTAKAGDKISQLIYRHNDVPLLWIHGLFIFMTEGMVGCYNYTKADEKYGTYKEKKYKSKIQTTESVVCSNCGYEFSSGSTPDNPPIPPDPLVPPELEPEMIQSEMNPSEMMGSPEGLPPEGLLPEGLPPEMMGPQEEECPSCGQMVVPENQTETAEIEELIEVAFKPKTRQHLEAYGGLYIKVPLSAKTQSDVIYLIFDKEIHYAKARAEYSNIREKIQPGASGSDSYYRQMRENNQYQFGEADNNVTKRQAWLKPEAFEFLKSEDADHLKKKFPKGVKICLINDELAEYEEAELDQHWTLTRNPLADYLTHDPAALLIVSVQEIMNDLVSLILQTVEHGIPQTFADPGVLDFKKYRQTEAGPGMIFPAVPKSGKGMNESFYEVKTATLSAEIFPFSQLVQSLGQQVSGALPSLFGGAIEGSKTASEYSMSRNQALQRLQNTWKIFTIWWKEIFSKAIPAYISEVKDDERFVQKDKVGNFINILIRKAELEGNIGSIELEANENLPLTWIQRKDIIMALMSTNNPQILEALAAPENLPIMQDALGLSDFYMPGEDDRMKQYDEIKRLIESEPIEQPPSEEEVFQAMTMGMPEPEGQELPSVEVDEVIDNHAIQFEICRRWLISDAGRLAKIENERGYRNVLLHTLQHQFFLQPPPQMGQEQGGAANPLETQEAPVMGEPNVV